MACSVACFWLSNGSGRSLVHSRRSTLLQERMGNQSDSQEVLAAPGVSCSSPTHSCNSNPWHMIQNCKSTATSRPVKSFCYVYPVARKSVGWTLAWQEVRKKEAPVLVTEALCRMTQLSSFRASVVRSRVCCKVWCLNEFPCISRRIFRRTT